MSSVIKVDQLQNSSGIGGFSIGASGDVTLAGTIKLSGTNAVVQELSTTAFTGANVWVTLGSVTIPQSGIWLIRADLRLRTGGTGYIRGRILDAFGNEIIAGDSSSSNSAIRMLAEQIAHEGSFNNIHIAPSWIIDMPTGLSYGSNVTLQVYPNASDGQNLNNNDLNGRPTLSAIRIDSTITTGTSVKTIGGA